MTPAAQFVYLIGCGDRNEGRAGMERLLGGKGAHLAEMSSLGIPVPPGFTITTDVCSMVSEAGGELPDAMRQQVLAAIEAVGENVGGARFGDAEQPLLVSVRSGAPISMPGMMDTVLNLGLNEQTVHALAKQSGDQRFALDSWRRFVAMFGNVVLGVDSEHFEAALTTMREEQGVENDFELSPEALRELVDRFRAVVRKHADRDVPDDPYDQLWLAISAVFGSWNSKRAAVYRRHHNISDALGTAVTVQSMVFGNAGDDCATGVAFTRNPATGERKLYGEYLPNAQGEDVVAGIRTPFSLTKEAAQAGDAPQQALEIAMPDAFAELVRVCKLLEQHYRDAQDIEFTVQHGRLWLLQTRAAKRTARAAVTMAVAMVDETLIGRHEALQRVDAASLNQMLHPTFADDAKATVLARALPASPGAASGKVALDAQTAVDMAENGADVILVRHETSPEDIAGMIASTGILTARGGMTSHAAVVARGIGTACVAGCGDVRIDIRKRTLHIGAHELAEGDELSIDGTTGEVLLGTVPTVAPELDETFERFMRWADEVRTLDVRANADTPDDATFARSLGAQGIGLCRTEHMFFAADRIMNFRRMILAHDGAAREAALAKLLPVQRSDFAAIFTAMDGLPVNVRLLDPPLHEFLPHEPEAQAELAVALDMEPATLTAEVERLREVNPMLGHRGCRLGITHQAIYAMQTRAIVEAALDVIDAGISVHPEIMVPLVGTDREFEIVSDMVRDIIVEVCSERGVAAGTLQVDVGANIEIPRACVVAADIADTAQFFSFGTNDLTQMTFGYSRDDAGTFLPDYQQHGVLEADPFQTLDTKGVGTLMQMAVEGGRSARPRLKVGICGEHGGDPASVAFCAQLGLDYVSCSPYRVPIARLAAAQAALDAAERPTGKLLGHVNTRVPDRI